jgi:hypothetical protein
MPSALNELGRSWTAPRQRPKFSDRATVTSDNYAFTSLHPVEHLSPTIAKFPHRHDIHVMSASPVRRDRAHRYSSEVIPAWRRLAGVKPAGHDRSRISASSLVPSSWKLRRVSITNPVYDRSRRWVTKPADRRTLVVRRPVGGQLRLHRVPRNPNTRAISEIDNCSDRRNRRISAQSSTNTRFLLGP